MSVGVGVGVLVGIGVSVAPSVLVGVGVNVRVGVRVSVGVTVDVSVGGTGEGVGSSVGEGMFWQLDTKTMTTMAVTSLFTSAVLGMNAVQWYSASGERVVRGWGWETGPVWSFLV